MIHKIKLFLFLFLLIITFFYFSKVEGPGGTITIKGKVVERDHVGVNIFEYPAVDQDVFIIYGNQNSSLPTIYLNLTGYLQSRVFWCLNFILTNTLKADFSFQDLQFKTYPITLYSTNALFDTSKVSTKLREVMRMDSISQ